MAESPTPSSSPATASSGGPQVSVHRWPWRTEEYVSMVLVFLVCLGAGYLTHNLLWLAAGSFAAVGGVFWLYRTKKKRTDISQVTITILGTVVRSESKGPLGKSQADIAKTETVSYRRFGSDETFMISDGNGSVRVPLRATKDPEVRRMVEAAFSAATNSAADARDLREKMNNGDLPV